MQQSDWPLHTISHQCAVPRCGQQNCFVFLFLQTFRAYFSNEWIIKFLTRPKGLRFLKLKKAQKF